jgi:NADH-quinone oxidoreductase subunit H
MTFAMFFLAEYSNMIWLSSVVAICFFGGWLSPIAFLPSSIFWLLVKTMSVCFAIIWVRANYPRYRYDQLMTLGWKTFLPFAIGYFLFATSLVILL